MVDIQFAAAEIRRGIEKKKERRKKPPGKNIMAFALFRNRHCGHDYRAKI